MGNDISKNKTVMSTVKRRHWRGIFSYKRVPGNRPMGERYTQSPKHPPGEHMESTLAVFISVFLPEFPHRTFLGRDHFQIQGIIAKGSFGPILKIKDKFKENNYAIKVLPKSEILKHGVLEQSKEEVIIQRQLNHPFIHNLHDSWQTQNHVFIMCDYCSAGDLYTYWVLKGQFGEGDVQLFAAELGSALGYLHDFGIMHRDVKMENILLSNQGHIRLADFGLSRRIRRGGRAFTICGTIQYMAPEVLKGGPYSHPSDWWSLGIMLFSLVTGKFPVPPGVDHSTMLKTVREFLYIMPKTLSPELALLISELLCKDPTSRLQCVELFKRHVFFRDISFDSEMLQKTPVETIVELRNHPDWEAKGRRGFSEDYFCNFDCDIMLYSPTSSTDVYPTLASLEPNQVTAHTFSA